MLTQEQGKKLISLARHSIETFLSKTELELNDYKEFSEKQGVFVTLKINGELRGCIGFTEPIFPLYNAIAKAARAAAFEDPRFPSLEKEELEKIKIELSVLTKPELIDKDYTIEVGKDGLIVQYGTYSGLLLPQVATEQGWDSETFLEQTCAKAGLPTDTWKDRDCKVYKFQAQIFEE
ncbi:TIGR00296 family protein [Nanoarchaeota archaeon]